MVTLVKHDRTTTILRNDTLNITGDQFIKMRSMVSGAMRASRDLEVFRLSLPEKPKTFSMPAGGPAAFPFLSTRLSVQRRVERWQPVSILS